MQTPCMVEKVVALHTYTIRIQGITYIHTYVHTLHTKITYITHIYQKGSDLKLADKWSLEFGMNTHWPNHCRATQCFQNLEHKNDYC
jgi:recombinational DNA repair protein RecR